jgi:Flp pilus assembly secretin CpaC
MKQFRATATDFCEEVNNRKKEQRCRMTKYQTFTQYLKRISREVLGLPCILTFLLSAGELYGQPNTTVAGTENAVVYPSIAVAVNKAIVIRLPKKAAKVAVTQPKIAEVQVVSPDTVLIHGKAIGATSLVVWFEEP